MVADIPTVPHVFVRGEGGSVFRLDLPLHETIEDRLAKGYIVRVANADGDPYVEGSDDPEVAALPTERPAINANKRAWVGWAVANGLAPDDAEALTKTDLIERYGAEPQAPASGSDGDDTPEGDDVEGGVQ